MRRQNREAKALVWENDWYICKTARSQMRSLSVAGQYQQRRVADTESSCSRKQDQSLPTHKEEPSLLVIGGSQQNHYNPRALLSHQQGHCS